MALQFHPNPGAILLCNYDTGFKEPEMVKQRPVVVVTPRLRRREGLCVVVPMSLTEPTHIEDYHFKLGLSPALPSPWDAPECWIKADMIATVGYHRLTPIRLGRDRTGKRIYYQSLVSKNDLRQIQRAVLCGLNLRHLTQYV